MLVLKQTSEIGLEQMDTMLNDLQELVQETKEMLQSAATSLEALVLSSAKLLAQETPSTSVAGPKKLKSKPTITQQQEDYHKKRSSLHSSLKQGESPYQSRIWSLD